MKSSAFILHLTALLPALAMPAPAPEPASAVVLYQCIVSQNKCPSYCAGGGTGEHCSKSRCVVFGFTILGTCNCVCD
ncbi:hypothetical protein QBC44DRAFT_325216 [Cladorrhinum sp. PSN332]|nr:hypothetical protein QBC44DRAFT_325216 [Cladorrhinum sp. PSN332]